MKFKTDMSNLQTASTDINKAKPALNENNCAIHKVGIITNYANTNYGSALQSCALQKILKRMGIFCENIRWRSNAEKKRSWLYGTARLGYHTMASPFSAKRRRLQQFRRFRGRYIKESKKNYTFCNDPRSLNQIYDAFICGSDQIWAPNQFHERYYLKFVNDSKRKIAYAPSIGLPYIPKDLEPKMAKLLKRIDYLSIREQAGAMIVKELTGRDAEVVLDPTMLLDREEWLNMASGDAPSGDYILCYFLGNNVEHRQAAIDLKTKTGWRLVVLPFQDTDYKWGDLQIGSAGPDRFLTLVDRARWVLTDSYHGMIFSILMNKPFSAFMRFTKDHPICQNSRIEHLLGQFGLEQRIVSPPPMAEPLSDSIDYEFVNKKVAAARRKSIRYLENALGKRYQPSTPDHA